MIRKNCNAQEVADWLPLFFAPTDVVEVRFINVTRPGRVHVGWFEAGEVDKHAKKIAQIANVSTLANFCPHVLAPAILSRGVPGQFVRVSKKDGVKVPQPCLAGDVTARRWLIIDVDPVRPGDCSATADEQHEAYAVARRIVGEFGDEIGLPIKVSSGNGWHLYYRLPELASGGGVGPDDEIATALRWIAAKYDTDKAKIDTGVYRSNQLMRLPGTWARKGEDTANRPWRKCEVATSPGQFGDIKTNAEFFAAIKRITGGVDAEPVPVMQSVGTYSQLPTASDDHSRPLAYLTTMPSAISGQRGSAATYAAATAMVHGFCLSVDDATSLLAAHYNPRCQPEWTLSELRHKCQDAADKPHDKPRGWLLESSARPEVSMPPICDLLPRVTSATSSVGQGEGVEGEADVIARDVLGNRPNRINESDNDPHRIGRYVLRSFQHEGRCTLAYWRGVFWRWSAEKSVWIEQKKHELEPTVTGLIREFSEKLHAKYQGQLDRGVIDEIPKSVAVTRTLIGNVIAALESMTLLLAEDAPTWLPGSAKSWPVGECVSLRNGVVHLPSVLAGSDGYRCKPSPAWFSGVSSAYAFTGETECPNWMAFLRSVWGDDEESVRLLQEWCGYLLTSDTSLQKMLLMVGPPRSGKGTISRVISGLVGPESTAGTSFQAMAEADCLASLMGKSVAMIEDGRVPGRSDAQALAANLLTISGEGCVFIKRKYTSNMSCKLGVRFVVCSNELPHIPDRGMALASRWSVLHFGKSFLGREDHGLADRLLAELPGIFRWAIDGWDRLRKTRKFTEPESSRDTAETLRDNSSPIVAFLEDYCHLGDGESYWVSRNDLFTAYLNWSKESNLRDPGSREAFGRNIRAAMPSLMPKEKRVDGIKHRGWSGVKLAEIDASGDKIDVGLS